MSDWFILCAKTLCVLPQDNTYFTSLMSLDYKKYIKTPKENFSVLPQDNNCIYI